jgi:hypothetical protein
VTESSVVTLAVWLPELVSVGSIVLTNNENLTDARLPGLRGQVRIGMRDLWCLSCGQQFR